MNYSLEVGVGDEVDDVNECFSSVNIKTETSTEAEDEVTPVSNKEFSNCLDRVGKFISTYPAASPELNDFFSGLKRKVHMDTTFSVDPKYRKSESAPVCY